MIVVDYNQTAISSLMAELGGQTVDQALAMGMEPADIWRAVVKNNPDISPQLK